MPKGEGMLREGMRQFLKRMTQPGRREDDTAFLFADKLLPSDKLKIKRLKKEIFRIQQHTPALTDDELKSHSAKHTLKFIEQNYVEQDDDAAHYTWGEILTATRLPKVTLFTWVDFFTLLALRYAETVKDKISKGRMTKIN
jgi:hypothetical protein